jgi:hypothetical protein
MGDDMGEVFFSQYDDEVLIRQLLGKIGGPIWKTCCELGAWDGIWLSNTAWLVRSQGWTGTFVEADAKKSADCMVNYANYDATVLRAWVTRDNVNDLVPDNLDLLSIDIDGNDPWVFQALKTRPRIVILEYNTRRLGLDVHPYDEHFAKNEANLKFCQATAAKTILMAEECGYRLAAADMGCNLFLVPEELHEQAVLGVSRLHYQVGEAP